MMTPDTHPSLADQAYQRLRQKIFDFELMPGDRISESDLARKVQLGRTPLRQALLRLSYDGFVESLPKVGWQVAAIDFDKIDELYDFRILIECDAVRRLCAAATPHPAIAELEAIWATPPFGRTFDGVDVGVMDERFHQRLVRAAGNAEMLRVHSDITDRIRLVRRLDFTKRHRIDDTYREHALVLRAIARRRTAEAADILNAHIEQSKAEVRNITLGMMQQARKPQFNVDQYSRQG